MAWPTTKSAGDTIAAAADWNNLINFAARKDASNQQTTGTYDFTGGNDTGIRDGTANAGILFHTSGTRLQSGKSVRVNIDADNNDADTEQFEIVKNTALISGGTQLFCVKETGKVGILKSAPETALHIATGLGGITLDEETTTPANPTASAACRLYMKADKLVIQYNDAGTVRYKYLDLTGTGVTWVHTTTAP